jgi:hypothetical protein
MRNFFSVPEFFGLLRKEIGVNAIQAPQAAQEEMNPLRDLIPDFFSVEKGSDFIIIYFLFYRYDRTHMFMKLVIVFVPPIRDVGFIVFLSGKKTLIINYQNSFCTEQLITVKY